MLPVSCMPLYMLPHAAYCIAYFTVCQEIRLPALQVAAGYSFGSAIAVFGGGLIYVKLSGSGRRNLVVTLCAVQAVGMWLLLQTTSRIPVVTLITLLGTAMR